MKLAIIDIDGTITRRSSERSFIKYLLRSKRISYIHIIITFLLYVLKHPLQACLGLKQNKMYLRNQKENEIRTLAMECFDQEIKHDIKTILLDEIRRLKSTGHKILLLSGSLPCLVEPLAQYVQADFTICSEVERLNGRFTGELNAPHPYALNKKTLAEQFCNKNSYDLKQSCAYGNDWSDRFLLKAVREAVAVDPDKKLRTMALRNNWKIIEGN